MARRRAGYRETGGLAWKVSWMVSMVHMAGIIVSAHSSTDGLPPHSRLHLPRNLRFTSIRRQQGALVSLDGVEVGHSRRSVQPVPYDVVYDSLPRWDDSVLVQFSIADGDDDDIKVNGRNSHAQLERISMLVHPVDNFLHPDARIVYTQTDPNTGQSLGQQTVPIARHDVLAYEGVVLHEHQVQGRLAEARIGWMKAARQSSANRGWARLVVSEDGDEHETRWIAQGVFAVHGEMHHLKSLHAYDKSRRIDEPHLSKRHREAHQGMVLLRDRDLVTRSPTGKAEHCGHDELHYNTDPMNPAWITASQLAFDDRYGRKSSWVDNVLGLGDTYAHPSSFSAAVASHMHGAFVRRQSTGGDIQSGGTTGNFASSIGSTSGCPKSSRVLYMGVAADCTYLAHYGGNVSRASTQILSNINSVSAIYQSTFNVSIGVIELQIPTGACPRTSNSSLPWNVGCQEGGPPGVDLNSRLSLFSQWRGQQSGDAGLWHLLTNCSTGSEVGVAYLNVLCRVTTSGSNGEYTSGTAVTAITSREWQVMAHEIGHNFGAIHDCTNGCSLSGSCCPLSTSTCNANDAYIMSPVSERSTTTFSPCSVGNICTAIGTSLNTTCLYTPGGRTVISLNKCGNGILEPGEECDPGAGRSSACCDSSTCKLRSGAQCDPSSAECCTSSCRFASNSTVCRPAVSATCDIAETCTGTSGACPDDVTKPDGQSCGSDGLACASGFCTSKDLQCRTAGSSLNITSACPNAGDTSCSVTCADPRTNGGSCIILDSQNFVSGTPCGYGGRCRNGACQSGPWQDVVSSWYTNNLRISIPVTVVGGIIVLLLLYGLARCLWRCCGREHRRNQAVSSQYYQAPPLQQGAVPPERMSQSYAAGGPNWQPQQPHPAFQGGSSNPYYR